MTRRFWIALLAVLLVTSCNQPTASNAPHPTADTHAVVDRNNTMNDLEQYQWKSRVLLIFTPRGDNPDYLEQQRLLEGREAELAERETLVMHCIEAGGMPAQTAAREQFGIAPDAFAVVLVGKDGTAKLTEHTPVALERIESLIDSMPMRQQEMR